MIVATLRLTSRLLMLSLGPEAFRTILLDYTGKVPPQAYGSREAEAFGAYLRELDLKVPHLAKVLEFEEATLATLADDQPRIVKFGFEPLPLLRALSEGRLSAEVGQPGDFEIELTAGGGSAELIGMSPESVGGAQPFH